MKSVVRKTVDDAVNKMLIKAYRQGISLSWDRSDKQQPQCGFDRMGLCCRDCFEGPCRISPFTKDPEKGICGRTKQDILEASLVRDITDGQQALSKLLSGRGCEAQLAINVKDDLVGYAAEDIIPVLGASSAQLLDALAAECPGEMKAGLGVLAADKANIVLYGHVAPETVKKLQDPDVALSAVCGAEGTEGVNSVAGYATQEIPLLTNAVDAVVLGAQCVMPAAADLAEKLGVPVFHSGNDPEEILAAAKESFAGRGRKQVDIPDDCEPVKIFGVEEAKALAAKAPKGAAYLGGCGDVNHTQGEDIVHIANKLIEEGYAVISTGCLGVTLARAGLPEDRFAYLGHCDNAGLFLQIGGTAVLSETVHSKMMAVAAAFAKAGIPVYTERTAAIADEETTQKLKEMNIYPLGSR